MVCQLDPCAPATPRRIRYSSPQQLLLASHAGCPPLPRPAVTNPSDAIFARTPPSPTRRSHARSHTTLTRDGCAHFPPTQLVLKSVKLCLYCFEKTVKFISESGLVYTSLQGCSFCSGCFKTFALILGNPVQMAIQVRRFRRFVLRSSVEYEAARAMLWRRAGSPRGGALIALPCARHILTDPLPPLIQVLASTLLRLLAIFVIPLSCAMVTFRYVSDTIDPPLDQPLYPTIAVFLIALVVTYNCMAVFACGERAPPVSRRSRDEILLPRILSPFERRISQHCSPSSSAASETRPSTKAST